MENRRDLFRKALTVAVAGTASTGLITSRALGNGVKPDLILPKELIVGQQVDVEAIKLELEEIWGNQVEGTWFSIRYKSQSEATKAEKLLDKWRLMPNINNREFYAYICCHVNMLARDEIFVNHLKEVYGKIDLHWIKRKPSYKLI